MKHERAIKRRQFLKWTFGAASLVAFAGCDNLTQSSWFPSILNKTEKLTERVQRAVTPANARAKEYGDADISKVFPANGSTDPGTEYYAEHVAKQFSEWTVEVGGLVQTPMSWSLAALKELPSRTQVTRHDCVEGWSAMSSTAILSMYRTARRSVFASSASSATSTPSM
jgi:DMSO/TMAO reductase YedYZ molybdopterin-dependent catalytic subunit